MLQIHNNRSHPLRLCFYGGQQIHLLNAEELEKRRLNIATEDHDHSLRGEGGMAMEAGRVPEEKEEKEEEVVVAEKRVTVTNVHK